MSKEISIGKVTCNNCGKEFYYTGNFTGQVSSSIKEPNKLEDWVHEFKVNRPGYGSVFDGLKFEFHLCDDCLNDIIKNMEEKPYDLDYEINKEKLEKIKKAFSKVADYYNI